MGYIWCSCLRKNWWHLWCCLDDEIETSLGTESVEDNMSGTISDVNDIEKRMMYCLNVEITVRVGCLCYRQSNQLQSLSEKSWRSICRRRPGLPWWQLLRCSRPGLQPGSSSACGRGHALTSAPVPARAWARPLSSKSESWGAWWLLGSRGPGPIRASVGFRALQCERDRCCNTMLWSAVAATLVLAGEFKPENILLGSQLHSGQRPWNTLPTHLYPQANTFNPEYSPSPCDPLVTSR